MLQNVFQFRCPFRKYSPHLVQHSTRMNLGLTQIITVILLIATITGTCQRVSRSNLKIKPKHHALTLKPRIKFPPKSKFKLDILTQRYLSRLIALSGDIHPNLGPYGRPICPCGSCRQPVRNRDKAIFCEECNQWHHIHCIGISPSSYNSLINQSAFWLCDHFGIPNITTSPSYIAFYYRPPNDHLQSLEALHDSLTKLYRSQKTPPNVVIVGNFNLPDINWTNHQTTNNSTASKHNKLLEITNDFGLQNMVNDPTRIASGNILDLILTSNPSIIINTHTTPGMSNHESVTFNVNLNPVRNKNPPHKVYSCKSADWDTLKDDIDKLNLEYFDMDPNSQDIDINWTFIRERMTILINNNIPRRYTKAKTHLPWITRELIRMQRRRNKSHKKAKQTGLNSDWEKFKELRKQATKTLAKSYKDYVNNHIGDSLKTNPKRFW